MATVVFFHAHPDDEAIATGGTMAGLADQGHRVVLVTATRGELGEIPDGLLDPGESLVERRGRELDEACRILGVADHAYLDYLDSGMAGEESNLRPGAFAAADVDEAGRALADILRRGVRRCPRRRTTSTVGTAIPTTSRCTGSVWPPPTGLRRPVLYFATMNRDLTEDLVNRIGETDWEPPEGTFDGMEGMGEPASRITTAVDVIPWIERKRRSMRAHASQISEESFFLSMPDDVYSMVWGREWFIRIRPVPARSGPDHWEPWLLLGADDGPTPHPALPVDPSVQP